MTDFFHKEIYSGIPDFSVEFSFSGLPHPSDVFYLFYRTPVPQTGRYMVPWMSLYGTYRGPHTSSALTHRGHGQVTGAAHFQRLCAGQS